MKDSSSRRVAPAVDVTEAEVHDALRRASIRQLARALDDGAFKRDHGGSGFTCPRCHEWSARVVDGWRWLCSGGCSSPAAKGTTVAGQGTKIGLRAAVAADYLACVSLVKAMRGGG